MRTALLQLCSSDDPDANLLTAEARIRAAAAAGAMLVLTPECTNLISASRARQGEALVVETMDRTLARLRDVTAELAIWLVIGSLAIRADPPETRFVNRCLVIGPDGRIAARYDKIHMFDVTVGDGESYRESAAYRPGDEAVVVDVGPARLGLSICYDLRFPGLFRALAAAGSNILTVPSAFTVPTGKAHWHVLLRARAIETGCFVLAPAQTGTHPARDGRNRQTYGHSLAVSPWGEILADAGESEGMLVVDLDLAEVGVARSRIPSLHHGRTFRPPQR